MTTARKGLLAIAAIAVVAALGWLDAITGPDVSFALLYGIPVAVVGWRVGRYPSLVVAMCAGCAWLVADMMWRTPEQAGQVAWNAGSRLVIFAALGWLSARLHAERHSLLEANDQLRDLVEREARSARTDALTGLPNFQGLHEHLDREIARSRRSGDPIALAFVDLDNFKTVNDLHGHAAGDALLRDFSEALRRSVRGMDIPARTGGDEFVVVLPGADANAARSVGERIQAAVADIGRRFPDCGLGASVGVVLAADPPATGEDLVHRADLAMYEAKRAGKGQVFVATEPQAPAPRPERPVAS